MEDENFDEHAEHILKKILRHKTVNSGDIEKIADYLEAHFSRVPKSQEKQLTDKNTVGRPAVNVDSNEVHKFIIQEIAGDPQFSETKLKKKVAKEFGIGLTKAIDFVKPSSHMPKLLRLNGLKSLIRRRGE